MRRSSKNFEKIRLNFLARLDGANSSNFLVPPHRCVAPCDRIKHFDLKHRVDLFEPESGRHSFPGRLKLRFQFSVNRQHVSDGWRYIGARSR